MQALWIFRLHKINIDQEKIEFIVERKDVFCLKKVICLSNRPRTHFVYETSCQLTVLHATCRCIIHLAS